ncbi:MAG: M15 family metallopeptidase [Deltaproteobacteria bacterium]|nr:M15 family metallopeptidase [Deltaproteobacteria bacterium]
MSRSSPTLRPRDALARALATSLTAATLAAIFALVSVVSSRAEGQLRRAGTADAGGAARVCPSLRTPDDGGHYVAPLDFAPPVPAVDGDDLLVLVNRSPRWVLAPGYAPRDLVDIRSMQRAAVESCVPPDRQCLRRDAAEAYRRLATAMRAAGHEPKVDSAFRGYRTQCNVFAKWAWRPGTAMGFCPATTASAIPGHSQHQLGTAMDLFTLDWTRRGAHFREGFGCSTGGRWLAENAWRFGFVLPYPLHPDYRREGSVCEARPEHRGRVDPRTGYKHEPWHFRFIGVENAASFHAAWLASGPASADEITLEQFLRRRLGTQDAIEPPVCEGCTCGDCATFEDTRGPCAGNAMHLTQTGAPRVSARSPTVVSARAQRVGESTVVTVTVRVMQEVLTQPPLSDDEGRVRYGQGESFLHRAAWAGAQPRGYPTLESTHRVGVALHSSGHEDFRWQSALTLAHREQSNNGYNMRIAAHAGEYDVTLVIEGIAPRATLSVAMMHNGQAVARQRVQVH